MERRLTDPHLVRGPARAPRPSAGWAAGNANTESITLAPLTRDDSDHVIDNLFGGRWPRRSARVRIADVAEGNPLFIEEIFRMLVDDGLLVRENDQWAAVGAIGEIDIPPTVNALLDARLEAIPAEERIVLQRASVMGKLFSWTAVAELSPKKSRPQTGPHLQALVRRSMIHPERVEFAGEDGFAFSHVLVRDAAYRSIPKETRASSAPAFCAMAGVEGRRRPRGVRRGHRVPPRAGLSIPL